MIQYGETCHKFSMVIYNLKFGPFRNLHLRPGGIQIVLQESAKLLAIKTFGGLDKQGFFSPVRPDKKFVHDMQFQEEWIPFHEYVVFTQCGTALYEKEELDQIVAVLKLQFENMVGHSIEDDILISQAVLDTCKDMRLAIYSFEKRVFRVSDFESHIDKVLHQFRHELFDSSLRAKHLDEIEASLLKMLKCMFHDFFETSMIPYKDELLPNVVECFDQCNVDLFDAQNFVDIFHDKMFSLTHNFKFQKRFESMTREDVISLLKFKDDVIREVIVKNRDFIHSQYAKFELGIMRKSESILQQQRLEEIQHLLLAIQKDAQDWLAESFLSHQESKFTLQLVCETEKEKTKYYLPPLLLSTIPYFKTLMDSSFQESQTKISTLYVGHSMVGKLFVQFLFGGVLCNIEHDTKPIFEELKSLADLLMFESLRKYLDLEFEYFDLVQTMKHL